MPFTPFHFGPGLFIKSLVPRKFNLTVFIVTQILIDSEVLWNLLQGKDRLHTFFHTYLGSSMVILIIPVLNYVYSFVQKRIFALSNLFKMSPIKINILFISALIGAWSHVFLDSIMHDDIMPLWPFYLNNPMFHWISVLWLHLGCLLSAALAIPVWYFTRKKERGGS